MGVLGRAIFWAVFSELLFIFLAVIIKDEKRRITVLVVGTIISGVIGFALSPVLYNDSETVYEIGDSGVTAIDNTWVVHNEVENGQEGVRIYTAFRIVDKKDVPCEIYIEFVNAETGAILLDTNQRYTRNNGSVSTSEKFTPQSNNSYYDKFMLFIPYVEIEGQDWRNVKYSVVIFDHRLEAMLVFSDWLDL